LTIAIFIHTLFFLLFWLTNPAYQRSLNDFLMGATGQRANFLLFLMIFAGLVSLWSGIRLVFHQKGRLKDPGWPYLLVGIIFLVFFYGSFTLVFLENSTQLYRLGQLYAYFRLFFDTSILLLLVWNLRRWVKDGTVLKKGLILAGLLILWLIPVILPPANVYNGELPQKPLLIAHRGAASLAPENTLASMQAAAELGVYGVETDISVSTDGVLFLMHDNTLARTTDVARIYPGRQKSLAETFSWNELSQLDAGSWFDGKSTFSGEPIPTLDAVLQVVKQNNLYFIYDLRIPSAGHPHADQALDLCLEKIKAAGVADHTWVLTKPDQIEHVKAAFPDGILTAGIGYYEKPPSPAALVAKGYQVVNSVYSISNRMIHAYQDAGLWVNLWLVDEPWQYSRLWLTGVNSVSSNYVQSFAALTRPVMAITYQIYLVIWGMVGLLAAWLVISTRQK
jgi:glycerophosphoryl diester phosphodiesterase